MVSEWVHCAGRGTEKYEGQIGRVEPVHAVCYALNADYVRSRVVVSNVKT